MAMTRGSHLFPSRTQKLSLSVPMVLGWKRPGRVGRCRIPIPSNRKFEGFFVSLGVIPEARRMNAGGGQGLFFPCLSGEKGSLCGRSLTSVQQKESGQAIARVKPRNCLSAAWGWREENYPTASLVVSVCIRFHISSCPESVIAGDAGTFCGSKETLMFTNTAA